MFSPQENSIFDRLVSAFSTLPEVEEVLVFGSRARGRSHDNSDLDVLVLMTRKKPGLLQKIQSLKWSALGDLEDLTYVNVFPMHEPVYSEGRGLFHANVKGEAVSIWKRKRSKASG